MELVGLQLDPLYNGSLRSMAVLSSRAQERRSREIRAPSTTEESGHRKEVAVVERFYTTVKVCIFCPPGRKKVDIVERWPLAEVRLYLA